MDQPHALPWRSPWSSEGLSKEGEGWIERDPEGVTCFADGVSTVGGTQPSPSKERASEKASWRR